MRRDGFGNCERAAVDLIVILAGPDLREHRHHQASARYLLRIQPGVTGELLQPGGQQPHKLVGIEGHRVVEHGAHIEAGIADQAVWIESVKAAP